MLNVTDEQDKLENNRQTPCVGNGLEEADNLSALELHNFWLQVQLLHDEEDAP